MTIRFVVTAFAALALVAGGASGQDMQGLWQATVRLGPDVRGPLLIYRTGDGLRAEVAGFKVTATRTGQSFEFTLQDGNGEARDGYWIQNGFATPLRLIQDGPNRWRGEITPLAETYTVFLPITRAADGTLRTYIRNPERNFGVFTRVKRIEFDSAEARLIGDAVLARGHYDGGGDAFSLPLRGATFDFARVTDSMSPFYPRGSKPARYQYAPPLQLDDGWPVATLADVGISRDTIERIIQGFIDMPMDSLGTLQLHDLLIIRHGKLVLEEYFHGYGRDMPHDTRSASKSWTATLIGAAMQAGVPLRVDMPVYQTMLGSVPADLDPRKRAMTLEHLLTMTAGFNCDPNDTTSADEDVMSNRGITNWWAYTLSVPLVSAPGDKVFYCSTEPNLAGGMLAKVSGESLLSLFDRLLGRPLKLSSYYLFLRDGDRYGGGGDRYTARDFAKLAQLMLNDGRWGGRQIVSHAWVAKATAPLRELFPGQQYGYLWNSRVYDYKGRKVRAYFAGGNGGQISMAIPELDLVICFMGGNYNMRGLDPQVLLGAVN